MIYYYSKQAIECYINVDELSNGSSMNGCNALNMADYNGLQFL